MKRRIINIIKQYDVTLFVVTNSTSGFFVDITQLYEHDVNIYQSSIDKELLSY